MSWSGLQIPGGRGGLWGIHPPNIWAIIPPIVQKLTYYLSPVVKKFTTTPVIKKCITPGRQKTY